MTDPIQRAHRARQIMSDDLFAEAKEHIESECFRLFKTVAPTDTEALQQIKAMQYMHEKYIAFFNRAIQDGKLAELEIERKKKTFKERLLG